MDLKEVIYTRRAVREYTAEPVDEKTFRELIGAAIQAPSAVNQQPWSSCVVRDQAVLAAYRAIEKLAENARDTGSPQSPGRYPPQ